MKHSDWFRLNSEGHFVMSVVRNAGYRITKRRHILSWTLSRLGKSYSFAFLPRPIGDWVLIPNDFSAEFYELNQLITQNLKQHRGEGR